MEEAGGQLQLMRRAQAQPSQGSQFQDERFRNARRDDFDLGKGNGGGPVAPPSPAAEGAVWDPVLASEGDAGEVTTIKLGQQLPSSSSGGSRASRSWGEQGCFHSPAS